MRVCGPRMQHFFQCGPPYKKFAHPWSSAYDMLEMSVVCVMRGVGAVFWTGWGAWSR